MTIQKQLAFVTFMICLLAVGVSHATDRPMNIVMILIDDLGWQDSSVVFGDKKTKFQDHFRTPNLVRLAKQGVRFSNAYSQAVCSPTRTSIMLGQNPARHHVTNWTLWGHRDQSGRTKSLAAPKKLAQRRDPTEGCHASQETAVRWVFHDPLRKKLIGEPMALQALIH